MKLALLTLAGTIYSGPADSVHLTTALGELTILPGHEALIAKVVPGEATVTVGDRSEHYNVSHGFLRVEQNYVWLIVHRAGGAT